MRTYKATRYICDCGKGFWNKQQCARHEAACTSWKNPRLRTCKTCKFGSLEEDSNGMEHELHHLQTWTQWNCSNPDFNYKAHFKPAHEKVQDLCINCPVWVSKKQQP